MKGFETLRVSWKIVEVFKRQQLRAAVELVACMKERRGKAWARESPCL